MDWGSPYIGLLMHPRTRPPCRRSRSHAVAFRLRSLVNTWLLCLRISCMWDRMGSESPSGCCKLALGTRVVCTVHSAAVLRWPADRSLPANVLDALGMLASGAWRGRQRHRLYRSIHTSKYVYMGPLGAGGLVVYHHRFQLDMYRHQVVNVRYWLDSMCRILHKV